MPSGLTSPRLDSWFQGKFHTLIGPILYTLFSRASLKGCLYPHCCILRSLKGFAHTPILSFPPALVSRASLKGVSISPLFSPALAEGVASIRIPILPDSFRATLWRVAEGDYLPRRLIPAPAAGINSHPAPCSGASLKGLLYTLRFL